MIISATILALSLLSSDPQPRTAAHAVSLVPAKTCVAADRTGTFRVTTKKIGGTALGLGVVLLETGSR
jgi:hypothetical protein